MFGTGTILPTPSPSARRSSSASSGIGASLSRSRTGSRRASPQRSWPGSHRTSRRGWKHQRRDKMGARARTNPAEGGSKMKRTLIFLLLIGGLFALIGGGGAVQVQGQGTSPLGIVPEPSELHVNIWVDKPAYRVGEEIVIHFWINRPAWVYIIDIDAAGYARLIFPNRFDRDNYIDQAGEYSLPGPSDPYRFVVVPPTGTEYLQIIASTQPLPLDVQGFREAFPLLGTDPGQVGAQIQGIIPVEAETATAWTSFQVFTHWPPPPPPPTNRPPVASFTWDPYYPWVSQPVTFNASSSYDPDGWITAYRWDFNSDGITDALGAVVTHAFTYSGSHPVTLTVVDNLGAAASITHTVWVRGYVPPPPPPPAPAAGFYIDIEPGNVLHITVQGSP
ncbi:TPA: DUF4384 domain-containing protein, partial [Candidatus Bipolaricaulota bacterium]|nr:DUF4384 domain-containing protein [Candidatus Bipolaricaulota bacterium]